MAAAPSVPVSPSCPLCHGVAAHASGSPVLSWAHSSDRGQGSATVMGAPRGHGAMPTLPGIHKEPEVPWEGETVLPWHRDSPRRLLGWASPSPLCPVHKHCGNTLCSPGSVLALWGCPVLPSPVPTQPSSTAHTSGMGTQMGHPPRHRKGQTRAPCFGLGSLSPQLFIFTHCTTIPVFTRLYLLYCVSWSCMYQRCPRPPRGHPVQPEPKCQRLKKCLNKPHVCTDTATSLLPWARARLAPCPHGTDGGGADWTCTTGGSHGPGQARHPHPWLRPAKSFP